MVQSTVADPTLRKGQLVDDVKVITRLCEGALTAGNLLKWGTDREVQALAMPALPTADVDAILTASTMISSTTGLEVAASSFTGVIGRDRIIPARSVTFTPAASSINSWNTASGELNIDIYGVDASGAAIKDSISRPNDASTTTYKTKKAFAAVTRIDVGASVATGGTGTIGVSNDSVELSPKDYPGFAIYEAVKEPYSSTQEFAQYDSVNLLCHGQIAVTVEHAVSVGDDVYIRVLESGTDLRGQATGQDGADTPATYARLAGAHFVTSAAADAVAVVEL